MFRKIKDIKYECIIFLANAVGMILELVASRILSPYFGNSNIIWTSIIGIILLSGSIGNYIGGKIADRKNVKECLKFILLFSAIFIFIIPMIQNEVLSSLIVLITNIKIGAILSTIILFLVPSIFLGCITPIILKLKVKSIENVGKVSGNLYAISTIGGIVGTFLGGFWLIPYVGSVYILYLLSVILIILTFCIDFKFKSKTAIMYLLLSIILIILMILNISNNKKNSQKVINGETDVKLSYDTQYGRVLIYNVSNSSKEKIRVLDIDSGYESLSYVDESKAYDLVSEYTKLYDLMFNANIDINNVAMIGGAGYSYPKHYISQYPNKKMDVIEIDGDITNIAKKYFYLDKLIEEYDLNKNERLKLINEDGRVFLNNTQNKYDAILNDAFSGKSPAKLLTTLENVINIKRCLNKNGCYLTNIISSLEGDNSKFLKSEVNTLKQVFKNVYVVPCDLEEDAYKIRNNMVIATDDILEFENVYTYNLNIGINEIILTDEYCPVDQLIPII